MGFDLNRNPRPTNVSPKALTLIPGIGITAAEAVEVVKATHIPSNWKTGHSGGMGTQPTVGRKTQEEDGAPE